MPKFSQETHVLSLNSDTFGMNGEFIPIVKHIRMMNIMINIDLKRKKMTIMKMKKTLIFINMIRMKMMIKTKKERTSIQ